MAKKTVTVIFRVTPAEKEKVIQNAEKGAFKNISSYLRWLLGI